MNTNPIQENPESLPIPGPQCPHCSTPLTHLILVEYGRAAVKWDSEVTINPQFSGDIEHSDSSETMIEHSVKITVENGIDVDDRDYLCPSCRKTIADSYIKAIAILQDIEAAGRSLITLKEEKEIEFEK